MRGLDRTRGELDHAVVVPGARAFVVLGAGNPNSSTAGMPSAWAIPASSTAPPIETWSIPGISGIGVRLGPERDDEHRVDEVRHAQLGLADEAAEHAGRAQATQAGGGKGHLGQA